MAQKAAGTVAVRLGFRVGEAPEEAAEDEAAAWFAAHPEAKPDLFEEEGSIFMEIAGESFQCADQMSSMVSQICFGSVASLRGQDEVLSELMNYQTTVRFRRVGEQIEVASNVANPVLFPAPALLSALVDAGERYIAIMQKIWPEDAADLEPQMAAQAAEARAALA